MQQVEAGTIALEELAARNRDFFRKFDGSLWGEVDHEEGCGLKTKMPFSDDSGEPRLVSGYDLFLPQIHGKNVIEVISEKVCHTPKDRKVKILDVGCWAAEALKDCAEEWGNQVDLFGINANHPPWFTRETLETLGRQNIKVVCGDAYDLSQIFAGTSFDVIVSNSAIGYMFDSTRVLEEIWQLLGKDGTALLNGFYWPRDSFKQDLNALNGWCKKKSLEINFLRSNIRPNNETAKVFDIADVTMVKTSNDAVKFPLKPLGVKKHYHSYPEILYYGIQF